LYCANVIAQIAPRFLAITVSNTTPRPSRRLHPSARRRRTAALALFLRLEELLHGDVDAHEARREEALLPALDERVKVRLADLDVEERERVEAARRVERNLVLPAVRAPAVAEKGDRDRAALVLELEARGADGVHDGGIVDDVRLDALGLRAEEEVRVRRRAERVAHDEKGDVARLCGREDRV
jgi:DNA-binding NarL/FixJ family response regulator